MNATPKGRLRDGTGGWLTKSFAFLLALLVAGLLFPRTSLAAEGIVDVTQKGSLTIHAFSEDGRTGYDGVTFSYVKVGEIGPEASSSIGHVLSFNNINSDFYKALGSPKSDVGITEEEHANGAFSTSALQTALSAHINDVSSVNLPWKAMPATTGGGDNTPSTSTSSDLDLGLYLVKQTGAPEGIAQADYTEPFLIGLPNGEDGGWNYDVTVRAKTILNNERISKTVDKTSAAIGSIVNYTVSSTAAVTANGTHYTSFALNDAPAAGLTLPALSQIVVSSSSLTLVDNTDYLKTISAGKIHLTLTSAGLAKINAITAAETITMTYPATLNNQAIVGGKGNVNTASLTTANNGIANPAKTATATVYSYGATLKKISSHGENTLLSGAQFKLYATLDDAQKAQNPISFYSALVSDKVSGASAPEVTTNASGLASFFGLAAGDYYLVEAKAPAGHSLLASPVKITISADTTGMTPSITVVNTPQSGFIGGFVLPGTGGPGTWMFVFGGIAVMGAAIATYVITRRRKSEQK